MPLRPNLRPEQYLLTLADEVGRIEWPAIFENDHPVELEIGSGKGTFLLGIAQARPEHNYVGIEYAKAYADFAADRLRRHGTENARMVCAEASWWVRCHIPDSSLVAVHVYFPDPWPKARHQKRRLIQLPFLKEVYRILKPGGKLRLVTDHADYFAQMQAMLAAQRDLKVVQFEPAVPATAMPSPARKPGEEAPAMLVGTNFEKKYIAEGRTFNATAAEKPI